MDEEVVEVATKVAFSFKPMVLAATAIVSLAAGVNVGLYVGNRRLKTKYEELAAKEIAEARLHYAQLHKKDEFATPEQAAAALLVDVEVTSVEIPDEVIETIREYNGGTDPRPALTSTNIFAAPKVDERSLVDTSEKFVSTKHATKGYVITANEFNDGEVGYNQVNLTFFEGDDILADERDEPILEVEETIGEALNHFGEGSDDPDTVFVRNDRIQLDFEITRSRGKYSVEVAGMTDNNLQHSDERMPRRRRPRDE